MKKILTATLLMAISLLINSCGKNDNTTNTLDPSNSCVLRVFCSEGRYFSNEKVRIVLKYQNGTIYRTITQFADGEYLIPKGGSVEINASGDYKGNAKEKNSTFMVGELNSRTLRVGVGSI